jgi:plastocyanin
MKKFIGLFILMIAFVAATGCTQQAVPEPVTTPPPTTVLTTIPTAEPTIVPTPVPTTVVTTLPPTVKRTESPSTKVVTTIHMKNNGFAPKVLTALPGTGITWINDDPIAHALKMSSSEGGFNSGDIMPGATWSYVFGSREGNFTISDPKLPEMTGMVIIKI